MNSENYIYFAKAFGVFISHPENVFKNYPDWADKKKQADGFNQNIALGLKYAKIFEVDEDVKRLLCLTDTPRNNFDLHLPFEYMFLDVSFTKDELASYGIEVNTDKIRGILVSIGILMNEEKEYGKALRITMFSQQGKEVWFDTFNKNIMPNEEIKNYDVKVWENPSSDKKSKEFVYRFLINFLNFMNNPEVELVEHKRSEKNIARKTKNGQIAIKSSYTIKVDGKLRKYIDEAVSGTHWNYGYRFWVRGHFRELTADRYSKKKRIWILPYIKGKGLLVEKTYEVRERE